MTRWERTIVSAFLDRYSASTADGEQKTMRLRSVSIFSGFDEASPDEKESYLEAAEALERKGYLSLSWEKHGKGERLKTLACIDMAQLFSIAGRKNRRTEAEEIRGMIKSKIPAFEETSSSFLPFLQYLAENFSSASFGRGIDLKAMEDLICLLEFLFKPEQQTGVTTRALSVMLYSDSKRLESLVELFGSLFSRIEKQGISPPDLSLLGRSFPEASISGKLIFEYQHNEKRRRPLLTNNAGVILYLPLPSVRNIVNIRTITQKEKPSVLTIENKETFFVLGEPKSYGPERASSRKQTLSGLCFDCCLYSGGYPNQAAAALIRVLAASGFSFYHAGDLDPDGILILQNIMDIAERPVTPVCMDAATFDRYLPWARPLEQTMLSRVEKIREDTRAIPPLAELIRRIGETEHGVEQEIIDYSS